MSSLTTTNTSSDRAITVVDWLWFTPAVRGRGRRAVVGEHAAVGAHAFEPETGDGQGTFSVCGMVPRLRRACWGAGYGDDVRRCKACERIIAKGGPAMDPRGPHAHLAVRGTP